MSTERKKPKFLRKDWHKMIKLGSTVKKKRKWRGAKGRQNKIRLERRGRSQRPKVGWGNKSELKGKLEGMNFTYIMNIKDLETVKKGEAIVIGSVGEKKRKEIIAKSKESDLKILNKYKVEKVQ
jgi:ribosomal protein L32E